MSKDRLLRMSGLFGALLAGARRRDRRDDRTGAAGRRQRRDVHQGHCADPAAELSEVPSPGSVAPMSLITYEEVRPWARSIKTRTAPAASSAGAMPPWFVEKNIGIQKFKNDPSLSDEEIAKIAKWADSGAPRGNPADMPPPRQFDSSRQVDDRGTGSGAVARRK